MDATQEVKLMSSLVNATVTTISASWLVLLWVQSLDKSLFIHRRPFKLAMSAQLLFASIRNITIMLMCSGFPISCRLVAIIGGIDYQFFAIAAEAAMYIRCRSFTNHRKLLTMLIVPTWVVRFALCIWLVTTIQGPNNKIGEMCNTVMDYDLSAIMQYIKIASELLILLFFMEHLVKLVRHSPPTKMTSAKAWRHLLINNCIFTGLIALSEILVGQITVYLTDYLFLTYSIVNLIQSLLLIFIVEDTRKIFVESYSRSNGISNGYHLDRYSHTHTPPGVNPLTQAEDNYNQGKPDVQSKELVAAQWQDSWGYKIGRESNSENSLCISTVP
ncbi:hypothetical protein K493DRAFT_390171 [Basidiobolus meristosporus CBS 931.73]|uniref:Uncharacterized protein n=1 Tax=Basidiobolus meristosporus CBS 931.73 TaxID=1314790 RepID=A0A1Y1X3H9_9FUNG|nr:hypothetical protein K493DRAFT_390171 [Basidiobolus meristosporus CBS 931.73]|eukprot:ORX80225.1 hypothetical protein K493DRAFT_390171 [Basidiobolus meristosporus CBS 931.73]